MKYKGEEEKGKSNNNINNIFNVFLIDYKYSNNNTKQFLTNTVNILSN